MKIFSRFIDLCLFRASPSDIPASQQLMKVTLVIYFILTVIVNQLDVSWNTSLLISLADILVMIIFVSLLLNFRNLKVRYVQVITALAGSGCVMTIVAFPVMWWFYQTDPEQQATSFAMMMIALLIWGLMVVAQIFRHALDVSSGTATIITIVYISISILVTGLVMSGVA
jgi:hypothetical protein